MAELSPSLKPLYAARREPALVDVPVLPFLMVDGQGDPNTEPWFQQAIEALYGVAYTVKFALKPAGIEVKVSPLEGLWWLEGGGFDLQARENWRWTLMLAQPAPITAEAVAEGIEALRRKKNPPALDAVRYEVFDEGRAAQILHVGPFSEEPATVERLMQFIAEQGLTPQGKHHELYLSDPRRTAPEKLKTILRHPVG